MTKKFLVQIQDSPRTRWQSDDESIRQVVEGVVSGRTDGDMPAVTVTQEERPFQTATDAIGHRILNPQ